MKGFTLLEVLVAVFIAGVLAAIAAPSWLSFVESREMGTIAEKSLIALRTAQSQAIQSRLERFIEFRENNGIEYSIYSKGASPEVWENIGEAGFSAENDFTTISFDFQGNVNFPDYGDEFPTIAFSDPDNRYLTCVQVRTLLGGMSIERDDRCLP